VSRCRSPRSRAPGEISLSYLEQLFAKLRKGALVKSVRGPGGGYLLAYTGSGDAHLRHHPRGRRADPRDALHARRAGRLPRQQEPLPDPRPLGELGNQIHSISARCRSPTSSTAACSAPAGIVYGESVRDPSTVAAQ